MPLTSFGWLIRVQNNTQLQHQLIQKKVPFHFRKGTLLYNVERLVYYKLLYLCLRPCSHLHEIHTGNRQCSLWYFYLPGATL
jgi:hypothetical protein